MWRCAESEVPSKRLCSAPRTAFSSLFPCTSQRWTVVLARLKYAVFVILIFWNNCRWHPIFHSTSSFIMPTFFRVFQRHAVNLTTRTASLISGEDFRVRGYLLKTCIQTSVVIFSLVFGNKIIPGKCNTFNSPDNYTSIYLCVNVFSCDDDYRNGINHEIGTTIVELEKTQLRRFGTA